MLKCNAKSGSCEVRELPYISGLLGCLSRRWPFTAFLISSPAPPRTAHRLGTESGITSCPRVNALQRHWEKNLVWVKLKMGFCLFFSFVEGERSGIYEDNS